MYTTNEVIEVALNGKQLSFLSDDVSDESNKNLRPIHYLGSKLRILDFIKNTIDILDPTKGRVCDLFAGSGTVSRYLSLDRPITSIDIQEYSRVICSALLNPICKEKICSEAFVKECIDSDHYNKLKWSLEVMINYEQKCISSATDGNLMPLCELLENGSIIRYEEGYLKDISNDLAEALKETYLRLSKYGLINNENAQIVRLFGGVYFSYYQSIQLDTILELIYKQNVENKDTLMAAVLSTASDIVNTVGKQFAQPLKAFNKDGTPKKSILNIVNRDRFIDVFSNFEKWLAIYINQEKNNYEHKVYKMDFSDALDRLENDVKVVYADPPYTRYHYSRYYHVLETICLRDNPNITRTINNGVEDISRGIYRKERHQSPFSIKTKAKNAFETMILKVRNLNASLIISYSPFDENKKEAPRLLTIDEIVELAKKYFDNVEIKSVGSFSHSKLNSSDKNSDISYDAEILIVCKVTN